MLRDTKMVLELFAGLVAGLVTGGLGTVYLIFRKGWVQAMILESIQLKIDAFAQEISEKPEILKPYIAILVNQFQDPELVKRITTPILNAVFEQLQKAGPPGEQGNFQGVPKKWRWIVDIGMEIFGPQIKEMIGSPGGKAVKGILGLPE
jgi:hypothetical protein